MRIRFSLCLLSLIVGAGCVKKEKVSDVTIPLNKGWKFKLGDSLLWAQTNFDDSDWDSAKVGHKSAGELFDKYNGFAWYRIKVFIPSSIIESSFLKDSLKIFLGAIDDCDQVYLNGKLIGENTRTEFKNEIVPNSSFVGVSGFWNKKRKYILPVTDKRISWNNENLIVVRIFDQWGGGGMYSDVPFLGMVTLKDYLSINTEQFYKLDENNLIGKVATLKNKSTALTIKGDLIFKAENVQKKAIIYKENFRINLLPGQSQEIKITIPISTDELRLTFEVWDSFSNTDMLFSDSIPYNLSK